VTTRAASASPRLKARVAGVFYLITIIVGGFALIVHDSLGFAAGLIAACCYIAVTLLFYAIFKPVSKSLSLLAMLISLAGCSIGPLTMILKLPLAAGNVSLVFFGLYCLLIGYLIFKSTFLPPVLGALMVFAGLGWLTFISSSLARSLYPYVLIPGILGEGSLTVWLLLIGLDAHKWTEQASARVHATSRPSA
jgi:uncharacterized protein DUF4386